MWARYSNARVKRRPGSLLMTSDLPEAARSFPTAQGGRWGCSSHMAGWGHAPEGQGTGERAGPSPAALPERVTSPGHRHPRRGLRQQPTEPTQWMTQALRVTQAACHPGPPCRQASERGAQVCRGICRSPASHAGGFIKVVGSADEHTQVPEHSRLQGPSRARPHRRPAAGHLHLG